MKRRRNVTTSASRLRAEIEQLSVKDAEELLPVLQAKLALDSPPEVIFMLIDGKHRRYRLSTMHNMPVYLPDD